MKKLSKIASALAVALIAMLAVTSCSKKDDKSDEPVNPAKETYTMTATPTGGYTAALTSYSSDLSNLFKSKNYTIEDNDESRTKVFNEFISNEAVPFLKRNYSTADIDSCKKYGEYYYFSLKKQDNSYKHVAYYIGVPLGEYVFYTRVPSRLSVANKFKLFRGDITKKLYTKSIKSGTEVNATDISDIVNEGMEAEISAGKITEAEIAEASTAGVYYQIYVCNNLATKAPIMDYYIYQFKIKPNGEVIE